MDDLIAEFLVEAGENLDVIDAELVRFEANPNERSTLNTIFRLLHTVKGTCGFLGLPRLEKVAHAGETLLDAFRSDRQPITGDAVTVVLAAIDRIKLIMAGLGATGAEPDGSDAELIAQLEALARGDTVAAAPAPVAEIKAPEPKALQPDVSIELGLSISEDDLEALFAATPGPVYDEPVADDLMPEIAPPAPAPVQTANADAEPRKPAGDPSAQSVRVDLDVLEGMMTLVSELVLTRNQLLQLNRQGIGEAFSTPLQRLSTITAELQEGVMRTRMQPIGAAWKKLPRLVRDLSRELNKKIDLVLEGEATELDRQLLEVIRDPLTHMVRNSADHGLESTADRIAAGKPAMGGIRLSALHEGGSIVIRLTDDGRGLDVVRIKAKAVERGILTRAEADAMSDGQAFKLIFAPGFSTAEAVTAVSGRGVGMDVVRSNIEQIGGQVEIASTLGQGAAFTIKIPLTLAIMPALVIGLSGQRFAVPQSNVTELVRAGEQTDHRIEVINGVRLLRLRDELLPLIQLAPLLGLGEASEGMAYVVVMQVGANRFGVAVDEILDTEEIVVKPLAPTLRDMGEYAGATILGDGSVILILEPNSLASMAGEAPASVRAAGVATDTDHAQARRSLLLVQAGSDALKVAPLDRVSRLEHARGEDIQMVGGRAVLQYRGRMMPILAVPGVRIRREGAQPLLVLSGDGFSMGLAVDAIVDMLEDHLSLEMEASEPGFLGSALVAGRTVEVIDVEYFLAIAGAELTAEARSQYSEEVAA